MVPSRREQRRRAKDNGIVGHVLDTIIVDDIRCIVIARSLRIILFLCGRKKKKKRVRETCDEYRSLINQLYPYVYSERDY